MRIASMLSRTYLSSVLMFLSAMLMLNFHYLDLEGLRAARIMRRCAFIINGREL
jgi:hypothetical protein